MDKKRIIAILTTIVLIILIFYKINFGILINTLKNFDYLTIPKVILIYIATLFLRGLRWKKLFPENKKYSVKLLTEIFTTGSMLNIYLPARAGDFFRAYYLGEITSEKKMTVFGTIILERLFDGVAVFIILLAALLIYNRSPFIIKLATISGFLFLGAICLCYLILKCYNTDKILMLPQKLEKCLSYKAKGTINKIFIAMNKHLSSFVDGFKGLLNLKTVFSALTLSLMIWILECVIAYFVLKGFNTNLGIAASLFVTSFTSFSTIIPSTSVFLGPFQYAYILATGLFGVGKSATLAIATVHQGLLMFVLTVFGMYYLLKANLSIKEMTTKIKNKN